MSKKLLAVVRFIEDPVRDEPRNVGVIGWDTGKTAARFLGEDEELSLNLRRVPPSRVPDRQTYREWVKFWRTHLEQGEVHDPERKGEVRADEPTFLDALANVTRGNFELRLGAEAYAPAERDLRSVVDEVFVRMVSEYPETEEAEEKEDRGITHRQLAQEAYWELLRNDFEEKQDFQRNYRLFGRTRKGAEVPAVFDFGVLPPEPLPLIPEEERPSLLVDAVSLNAPEEQEVEVIDRARAVATKSVETREAHELVEVRALVTNGQSPQSDLGAYALSILRDEAGLETVSLQDFPHLIPEFRR